jgi:predicted nuclease of restriction endonuclease-like (RecB) superfamily
MSKIAKSEKPKAVRLTFKSLVGSIQTVHEDLAAHAGRAVNISLTLRNWLIGCYIAEYELHGADRARYGEKLLHELAQQLGRLNISNCSRRQLYRYVRFYRLYPAIVGTLSPQFRTMLPASTAVARKVGTVSAQSRIRPAELIQSLAYSHLELIVDLDDDASRAFYETECLQGHWSVRELKRQIASLYFERSGLSRDQKKLAALARRGAEKAPLRLDIRDPYVFEFLGLKPREVMGESHLEDQLLDKLQEFLLELGHGFCFEARQKRILIGDSYGFVDLVFYHRILKCHVLLDLKLEEFSHENIGQLNTYVTWYRKHMMTKGDNLPVGILLCARKDHTLVEYALAGMDNRLFVSKYQLHLPKPEQLRRKLERALQEEQP